MQRVLEFIIIWLSIDIVLISTGWYATTTISQLCPKWWQRVVVDSVDPHSTLTSKN